MTTLWQKTGEQTNPAVNQYIISNLAADTILLPYDVQASIAQANMLASVGLITSNEADSLVNGLETILKLHTAGQFKLQSNNEDVHTAIEQYLTEQLGEVGKKIHMGRSRNDQVLVALRLYTADHLRMIRQHVLSLAETILQFAKQHEFVPMPGYTHTQQAMLSSVGQWAGAFVESLLDDELTLDAAKRLNNQNPLGSAAGFGTSLPLDRTFTTQALGFDRLQLNTLYCQNSRGKIESFVVQTLTQVMMTLGKVANDLIWFTSSEFAFFTVDHSLTTGSSIMPQKRNLDIMEVVRANVAVIMSDGLQIQMASHNLLSGYNKDLKITKQSLINAFTITEQSIKIVQLLFQQLTPNIKQLNQALRPEIYATDQVNQLVQAGTPFRDAYQQVGAHLNEVKAQDPIQNLKSKTHLGAPGNLALDSYYQTIQERRKQLGL